MEALSAMLRDEPTSSRTTYVPSSFADGRNKGVAEDSYKMGSDLDVDVVRIMGEGLPELK